jgi:hypothetical protein
MHHHSYVLTALVSMLNAVRFSMHVFEAHFGSAAALCSQRCCASQRTGPTLRAVYLSLLCCYTTHMQAAMKDVTVTAAYCNIQVL